MAYTNINTIYYKGRTIDIRTRTVPEINALRHILSEGINSIGNQLQSFDRGELDKNSDWRSRASSAMEAKADDIEKLHRHLTGRANEEGKFAYAGIDENVIGEAQREKIRAVLDGVIPDEMIVLVMERIDE